MSAPITWTDADLDALRVHYSKTKDMLVLAGMLGGRHTIKAIRTRANSMGLRKPPPKRRKLGRTW